MKICENAMVIENRELVPETFSLLAYAPHIAACAMPGMFVNVSCPAPGALLRRPISICGAGNGKLRLVYELRGLGTYWLSGIRAGESIDLFGPLGHGFDISDRRIALAGGGLGAAPLLFAAAAASASVDAVLGFRSAGKVILQEEFAAQCGEVLLATDDGSAGIHGAVTLPLAELLKNGGYDAVLACGPRPMLKAVAALCDGLSMPCQVSLEERMACGVGACLVCACETKTDGGDCAMSRVCCDGPVFDSREVVW